MLTYKTYKSKFYINTDGEASGKAEKSGAQMRVLQVVY